MRRSLERRLKLKLSGISFLINFKLFEIPAFEFTRSPSARTPAQKREFCTTDNRNFVHVCIVRHARCAIVAVMFIASSLLSFGTQPLAWALLLLTLGLLLMRRWRGAGTRLCWAALLVLAMTGWQLPVDAMLRHLEDQSPAPDANASLSGYAGVVVLGGALERSDLWNFPGRIALNSAAERMIVPIGLMQRNSHLKLLFTGGEGSLVKDKLSEADRAKIFFDSMGVDPARMIYESRSRTTFDNAILSAQLPGVDKEQPWLLLTTAAHMPRSLAVFRKAGWKVTPYSVDYRTTAEQDWTGYSLARGAEKWHYALHEIIGYWAYGLAGRL